MTDTSRVQRWREAKRDKGLKAVTIWLTTEEELRLKDLALQWHCSPSAVVQQALAQVTTSTPPQNSIPPDTLQIRELVHEAVAPLQAEVSALQGAMTTMRTELASATDTVTETVTATLAQDLPALVRQQVEGLALEVLGVPVTDTNGNGTVTLERESVTGGGNGGVTETRPSAPGAPRLRLGENKLTLRQVKALQAKRAQGASIKELQEEFGISRATVHRYLKT